MFCKCGKLMTEDENGYFCICGLRKTFDGADISDSENERIAEIKKKYRSKYPNMNDPVIRVVEPIAESEEFDETFSDVPPSQRNKEKIKKKGWFKK
ncbi:MAG: hypothetical protein IJE40_00770 [Clostridia bacterium]|nr:hypothetical protein [Clostridia bacterium]